MPKRQTDDFWHGPAGPRNRQVSAVVVASSISPWEVTRRTPTVWINPWANQPFAAFLASSLSVTWASSWVGDPSVNDLRQS